MGRGGSHMELVSYFSYGQQKRGNPEPSRNLYRNLIMLWDLPVREVHLNRTAENTRPFRSPESVPEDFVSCLAGNFKEAMRRKGRTCPHCKACFTCIPIRAMKAHTKTQPKQVWCTIPKYCYRTVATAARKGKETEEFSPIRSSKNAYLSIEQNSRATWGLLRAAKCTR